VIRLKDKDLTHEKLLLGILAAQKIQGRVKETELRDWEALRREYESDLARFSGKTVFADPRWSPDGKYLLESVWKDGAVSYRVVEAATDKTQFLPELGALPLAVPQWSYDSRYVAYGSAEKVLIYDLQENKVQVISLSQYNDNHQDGPYVLTFSFNPADDILYFSFDVEWFNYYKAYLWDARDGSVKFFRQDQILPWLDEENLDLHRLGLGDEAYQMRDAALSPAGNKVAAVVRGEDGLTTIRIINKENEVTPAAKEAEKEEPRTGNLLEKLYYFNMSACDLNKSILVVAGLELLVILVLLGRMVSRRRRAGKGNGPDA
jgi:hypothetical protein